MQIFNTTALRKKLKEALKEGKVAWSPGFGDYLQRVFDKANGCYGDPKWLRERRAEYHEEEANRYRTEAWDKK
jgi:hypothetical protein